MDVTTTGQTSNTRNRSNTNLSGKNVCRTNFSQYSLEIYFIWFSALIFLTELVADFLLATFYFQRNETKWGAITLGIIIIPLLMCNIGSIIILKTEKQVTILVLLLHLLLLAIPYRYHNILRTIDKYKMTNREMEIIKEKIKDINAIQILNTMFQYCPQFLFQAYLIIFRKYKFVLTGLSAGLAGFALFWHIFVYFYYLIKRNGEHKYSLNNYSLENSVSTRIIDNLSTTTPSQGYRNVPTCSSNLNAAANIKLPNSTVNITDNIKIFEKTNYITDDKNFVSKQLNLKNVEKHRIFNFNKRKPIYEQDTYDINDTGNQSTVFFEINESGLTNKLNLSANSKSEDNILNENSANMFTTIQRSNYVKQSLNNIVKYNSNMNMNEFDAKKNPRTSSSSLLDNGLKRFYSTEKLTHDYNIQPQEIQPVVVDQNSLLKRKGICSSQEMLHLVDIINDNISAEQVDILAKNVTELGGDESLILSSESGDLDNSKLMDMFPNLIDEKTQSSILENIDAAIYENQIFEKRIRKNQLTIQNLKLQDQILSSCIDVRSTLLPYNHVLNPTPYENVQFSNITRPSITAKGLRHWKNYLCDIDTNMHDSSTAQSSNFYINTTSNNSYDLYIDEIENNSSQLNQNKICNDDGNLIIATTSIGKKQVHWSSKLAITNSSSSCGTDENLSEDIYITMCNDNNIDNIITEKNILVETINKINVDSPVRFVKPQILPNIGSQLDSISEC